MRRSDRDRDDQFRAYVLQTRGSLLRTATLLASGNAHLAEDLVQTVLLRMYVSWPRIRADTRDAYARKMLVNAHIDERRRPHARHEQNRADVPDVGVESDLRSDAQAAAFGALAELPPRMGPPSSFAISTTPVSPRPRPPSAEAREPSRVRRPAAWPSSERPWPSFPTRPVTTGWRGAADE